MNNSVCMVCLCACVKVGMGKRAVHWGLPLPRLQASTADMLLKPLFKHGAKCVYLYICVCVCVGKHVGSTQRGKLSILMAYNCCKYYYNKQYLQHRILSPTISYFGASDELHYDAETGNEHPQCTVCRMCFLSQLVNLHLSYRTANISIKCYSMRT